MKLFITGVNGQLGHDIVNEALKRGHSVIGSDIAPVYKEEEGTILKNFSYVQVDITDAGAVSKMLSNEKPEAVIHCAAWTAVDAAEDEENKELVFDINANGTRHIAENCKQLNCKMLYISTDYVFDGSGEEPWKADSEMIEPVNFYGLSKYEGEVAVRSNVEKFYIVRIAWVFGKNGKNFIKTMLSLGEKHESIRVVNDQVGTPTYTYDLARLLVDMVETDKYGIYHATNEGGYISWADFAGEIFRQAGMKTKVIPVTTEEYGVSKAARPRNSKLDKSKLVLSGFTPLPDWRDALSRFLKEI